MKHLLAATMFAALLAAAPAGAQTVYGSVVTGSSGVNFGAPPGGNFRANFLIDASVDLFTTNPASPSGLGVPDPLSGDFGATLTANNTGGMVFNAQVGSGGSGGLSSFGAAPVNATSPVPEPTTWAMMLVGFGAVGGMLRTRKATLRYA